MNFRNLHVIYFDSKEIKRNDILWGLIGLRIDVTGSPTEVSINLIDDSQVETISREINGFDYAITQDFCVNVAEACHIMGVKYISWIYDSPQVALYTKYALYPENYVFCFDKEQTRRMKELGIPHVFYQPLAGNTLYLSTLNFNTPEKKNYRYDVSFVGQLYASKITSDLYSLMDESEKFEFEETMQKYICNWGPCASIYACEDSIADKLSKYITKEDFKYFSTDPVFITKTLCYAPYIAHKERLKILKTAASSFKTALYTRESDIATAKEIPGLNVFPPVKEDVPYRIYNASKMCLNLTLRSIETGAPQRIFDIMAARGVVITNFQQELTELFVPDKEIVLFRSIEEFVDKANFLLSHESVRNNIANAGCKRIQTDYNYQKILPIIFEKTL